MPDSNNLLTNQPAIPTEQQNAVVQKEAAVQPNQKKPQLAKKKFKPKEKLLINLGILGVINLICVLILVVLLGGFPQKAEELKRLRNLSIQVARQLDMELLELEIINNKPKADKLLALFPDETKLLEFIREIDKLKNEGVIIHFSFANNDPVKDKTEFVGLPIIIELRGSWAQIDSALKRIEALPFLTRVINIEIRQASGDNMSLKYGGILYVSEKFNKN